MKLNGSHKFKANSWQVFNAILNPAVLQSCIPGCKSVEYVDPTNLRASITTPLPGLKGPYRAVINISQRQEPNVLVLHVKRQGTGGSINAVSQIIIQDEQDGALLTRHRQQSNRSGYHQKLTQIVFCKIRSSYRLKNLAKEKSNHERFMFALYHSAVMYS